MNEAEGAFVWLLPRAAEACRSSRAFDMELLTKISHDEIIGGLKNAASRGVTEIDSILSAVNDRDPQKIELWRQINMHIGKWPLVLDSYPMPIKRGGSLDAAVVNPLSFCRGQADRDALLAAYDATLTGETIDVWIKRQNTLKFVSLANSRCADHEREFEARFPKQ